MPLKTIAEGSHSYWDKIKVKYLERLKKEKGEILKERRERGSEGNIRHVEVRTKG